MSIRAKEKLEALPPPCFTLGEVLVGAERMRTGIPRGAGAKWREQGRILGKKAAFSGNRWRRFAK